MSRVPRIALFLMLVCFACSAPRTGRQPAARNVRLAWRIAPVQWETGEQFARLLALLKAHASAVDEISLFDEAFPRNAATPLTELERLADLLKQRIGELHRAGFPSAGINVILTLGHQDVPGGFLPPLSVPPAVGHDGRVSTSCVCPNSPAFRSYIRRRYAMMARAKPDFIWVDDDMRGSHHGPTYPCFCPLCLKKFGRAAGRVSLVKQLNAPENGDLRRQWSEFMAASLEGVCKDIGEAVREVDPNLEVGLMTIGYSHSTYAGYPIRRMMRALGAKRGRPGHGYYTDDVPRMLIGKALDVGRQVRDYPPEVRTIEYELENYPYIALDKASRTVLNECTAALIMGANGIAFNALKDQGGTLEDYEPLMQAIAAERPVWEALVRGSAGLPLVGLWPADTPALMANRTVDEQGWFQEPAAYDIQRPNQVAEMGIPLTTDRAAALGAILSGRVAEGFSNDELRAMLARAVLMDGAALRVLWTRGLGELTGVKPGTHFPNGVVERFTNHPLNGPYAGDGREALPGPADDVWSLAPVGKGVEELARLIRYDGADMGACFTIYTNSLGGRVAVSTYSPWRRLGRGAKKRQLAAVADWLAGGRLPALIEQTARVAPWVRSSPDGRRVAVVLLNTSLDPTGGLTLRLRAQPARLSLVSGPRSEPLTLRRSPGEVRVEVPSIPAWHAAVLIGE